jgi:hypothetical protein
MDSFGPWWKVQFSSSGTHHLSGPTEGTFTVTCLIVAAEEKTTLHAHHRDLHNVSHSYEFYEYSQDTDRVGGYVLLYLPNSTDIKDASFNGEYGNPTIQFDSSIGVNPNVLITLSASVATARDSKYFETEDVKMQEIVLTEDVISSVCASLKDPGNPLNPVFALFNGVHWIHDPRFVSRLFVSSMMPKMSGS